MAKTCFECRGTGRCDCIVCVIELDGKYVAGPCIPCQARKVWDKLRPILEKKNIDPRDHKHYRLVRPLYGAPHRVFLPEEQFNGVVKTRKKKDAEATLFEGKEVPKA